MATEAQIAANRANAQLSTGPASEAGKTKAAQNARKHGFYTKHHVILPDEEEEQYDALLETYNAEFQPRTPSERQLVRELAESQWRLARIGRYEARALAAAGPDPGLDLLLKYERLTNSAHRTWHKSLETLRGIRKTRQHSPLFLVPNEKIEETNPIREFDDVARLTVMPPPPPDEPGPSNETGRIPYEIGTELKQLKRFYPNFDPRRSSKHMSNALKAFLKDRNNLKLVLNAMVFL